MTDITRIKREGYGALLADHCELADTVAALLVRVAALEAKHPTYTAVYELADPPMSVALGGTPGTSWAPGCAMDEYAVIADGPGFIHSPGYEQEEAAP